MKTTVVLPVKRFARAKLRLASVLDPRERQALMAAMLTDVLSCLQRIRGLHELVVVSAEPVAAELAGQAGARLLPDLTEENHSQAARDGAVSAAQAGAERVLMLAADCPLIAGAEVEELLAFPAGRGPRVTVVTDRAGEGTNALLLEPPDAIAPTFGPGSFARHHRLAEQAGVRADALPLPSLLLDVDTPDDLLLLRDELERAPQRAPHTAVVVAGLGAVLPAAS